MSLDPRDSTEHLRLYCCRIGFITSIRLYGILPSTMQSHPRLSIAMAISITCDCSWEQSSIVRWPWLEKYASIILHKSGMTFALSRTSMTASIDWRSCRRQPGAMHCVRCFEFSFSHPHCGHLFTKFLSHSDNFELQPHQPETCLVTNVWNILGYPAIPCLYPAHQIELNCVAILFSFHEKTFSQLHNPRSLPVPILGTPIFSSRLSLSIPACLGRRCQ
jgi:hypothetical protein